MARLRRTAVGASRAVVALCLVLTLSACGDTPGRTVSAAEVPAPPPGTRWVGSGRVVVAVPDWWSTGETRCLAPVEDTVYADTGAVVDCADPPAPSLVREVSALAVMDATTGYGEHKVRSMDPVGEADGHEVVALDGCEEWFEGVCRRMFAVPSEGVAFAVTIAEEGDGDAESIRDSVRVLPEGWTTVPLATAHGWTPTWGAEPGQADALVAELRDAGLAVEVRTVERPEDDARGDYAALPVGSLLEVRPELGSVIEVGGTVTVSLSGRSLAPPG